MKNEHKLYLERLRRSGVTNMFGAAPYLADQFGLKIGEARAILQEWMNTYDPKDYEGVDL